jgi:hypothetical protein
MHVQATPNVTTITTHRDRAFRSSNRNTPWGGWRAASWLLLTSALAGAISSTALASGITHPDVVLTPANIPLQPVGTPFVDTVFGTTLTRITGQTPDGMGTHIYSQLQAFSADNAYVLLIENDVYVVRRMSDLSSVQGLDTSGWNAPRWYPAIPHTIVHFDGNDDTVVRVQLTDLDTQPPTTTTVFTFPQRYQYVRGKQSFDELSLDGQWVAGAVTRNDGAMVLFSLNLSTGVLSSELAIPDLYSEACEPDPQWGDVEPDWVGVSPLGRYLMVQWVRDGTTRCSGLESFDIVTGQFRGRVTAGHQHGDLGVDTEGVTEYFVTTTTASPENHNYPAIVSHDLPGTETVSPFRLLLTIPWRGLSHVSCRGPGGLCLVTSESLEVVPGLPAVNAELYLVYANGSVRRLTHHRSTECGYWVQPRASLSHDGLVAIFASDWGVDSCGVDNLGRGEAYIIDLLPEDLLPPGDDPILSVSVTGPGRVTSQPGGIDCAAMGGACAAPFTAGTSVTLTATPDAGAAFSGWSGACSGTGSCTVSMDADCTVSALFSPGSCSGQPTFIAASAHASGVAGSEWRTDLSVFNSTSTPVAVYLSFLASDQDGSSAACVPAGTLGGGSSMFFEDLVDSVFDVTSGTGGIAVYSDLPDIGVMSRTYSQTPSGTFGQTIPGRSADQAIGDGETRTLLLLHENQGYRTNIGFMNTAATPSTAVVDLYNGNGSFLGQRELVIPPLSHHQEGQIFNQVTQQNVTNGRAEITISGGPVLVYGSVVDNGTSDPSYIEPR